jgi:hypothetical protein
LTVGEIFPPCNPSIPQSRHSADALSTDESRILNLSLGHHARDTQYLTPQTNISSITHSTESVETYRIRSVSLVCAFRFVPAAFSLGAPVFIVRLAGSPFSLVLGSASATHAHPRLVLKSLCFKRSPAPLADTKRRLGYDTTRPRNRRRCDSPTPQWRPHS